MHPSQLREVLLEQFPELADFQPLLLHEYASLIISLAARNGFRHHWAGLGNVPDDAQPLHCRTLGKRFGQGGFEQINNIAGCVERTNNWSASGGIARAHWLTGVGENLLEITRQRALGGAENDLLTERGRRVRKRKNGIFTSRDSQGNCAVTNNRISWAVPVNMQAIEIALGRRAVNLFPELSAERAALTDRTLRAIHTCALNGNIGYGKIPQEYREYPSGRLYSHGALQLQNVTRETKQVALAASHEYDFSNCHWGILANVASALNMDSETIHDYCLHPQTYRTAIADEVGITPKQAKKCLLMLIYGAQKSLWPRCSIPEEIGPDKAALLYQSPVFDSLSSELLSIIGAWRNKVPRHPSGAIINIRGKALHGTPVEQAAHLLQGVEAAMLEVVLNRWGDLVLLLQHDGFVLSEYVHPEDIEAEISYEMGLDMPVTYELLGVPELWVNA